MLKQVKDGVYYFTGPINMGIIETDRGIVIIDTGLDNSYGRKLLKISVELKKEIIGIINTHSHADHFGGNNFLKKRTDAWTMASKIEKALIENPIFEPMYLFGGVPFPEMRTKFLEGKPSLVDMSVEDEKAKKILEDLNIEIIELPGHSPAQIGVIYQDVIFIGDTVMPKRVIEKYKLGYLYDAKREKETLLNLQKLKYNYFIPGHGELFLSEELKTIVDINLKNILSVEEVILRILKIPYSTEEAFSQLVKLLDLDPDLTQILLLFSTFKGFLTGLKSEGLIEYYLENGKIIWKKRA